ncbi:hypothetical protein MHSWG343_05850 [Candidatus Mycoplasma haematohominis]|uniref:Uncharacterized protein n=1 Tax=Candidatus Mycoplasma haematohominis TaxID=1494318 RepID=A0A478FPZ2_9MOLU|nr:hypothetical protein MHSWG343_05850 [Candidatus Mycoplasma haemohominis]
MKVFSEFFNHYGIPLLFVGSTGTGIKLYFAKAGYLTNSQLSEIKFVLPEKKHKYSDEITNAGFTLVTSSTTDEVMQNIIFQRLFPNKDVTFSYSKGQVFAGSTEVKFEAKVFKTKNGKELKTISKPDKKYVEDFRKACLSALDKEYQDDKDKDGPNSKELARLREWCTEPKIKDVLSRHKFTLLKTDENNKEDDAYWQEIIKGGWFSNTGGTKYWEKQTFIKEEEDLKKIIGDQKTGFTGEEVKPEQIAVLKKACKAALDKEFTRENFYLTKDLIDNVEPTTPELKVDLFQEAALFCSKPISAKEYIEKAMQGIAYTTVQTPANTEYCEISEKNISEWKTNNPLDGKTFWCGVKLLYEKSKNHQPSK